MVKRGGETETDFPKMDKRGGKTDGKKKLIKQTTAWVETTIMKQQTHREASDGRGTQVRTVKGRTDTLYRWTPWGKKKAGNRNGKSRKHKGRQDFHNKAVKSELLCSVSVTAPELLSLWPGSREARSNILRGNWSNVTMMAMRQQPHNSLTCEINGNGLSQKIHVPNVFLVSTKVSTESYMAVMYDEAKFFCEFPHISTVWESVKCTPPPGRPGQRYTSTE